MMRKFGKDDNTILYYAQEITSKGWNREFLFSAITLKSKPIGVADYQLIVPQDELKKIVAEEVEAFGKELPHRTKNEEGLS